jgi:chromosome segregation ATPase
MTNDFRLKPPMDLSQVTQMASWLDEERRKDKKLISDLLKRIDDQTALSVNQGRRIEDLDARLAAAQGQLPRLDQIEALQLQTRTAQGRRLEELDAHIAAVQNGLLRFDQVEANMQQVRTEAASLVPRFEHELRSALDQTGQSRALERERDSRAINELRTPLESLPEIQRRLDAQTTEDRRLNEQFPLLHAEYEKLHAALELIPPRLRYLEEWGERLTIHISDLKLIEGRIKGEHGQMLETIRRSEEDHRQQLALWSGEVAEHRRQVDAAIAALPPLDDVYEQARRVLKHFESLEDEIRAEQTKIDHLLELSEQHLKETLAEWRSEHEKNWEQHVTTFDLYRRQQREGSDAVLARLETLELGDAEQRERWHALRETLGEQHKRKLLDLEREHQDLEDDVLGKKWRS